MKMMPTGFPVFAAMLWPSAAARPVASFQWEAKRLSSVFLARDVATLKREGLPLPSRFDWFAIMRTICPDGFVSGTLNVPTGAPTYQTSPNTMLVATRSCTTSPLMVKRAFRV